LFRFNIGFWGLVISGTLLLGVATILAFFGGAWWRFDLLANFRLQYLFCLLIALVLFLVGKKWVWAGVAGVFALVNFADILPAFLGRGGKAISSSKPLTILLANVLTSNKEYERVRQLVRSTDPDIFAVLEVSETWMNELSLLKEKLPHVVSCPRDDNFGIALFSRIPFEESEIVQLGEAGLPTAVARIRFDDTTLTVIATHPLPPTGASIARQRNRQLGELAEYVRSVKGPVIVMGDLNTTPYSPHFKKLLCESGLQDSRRGRGIQPSWRADIPWFLRIPLDHILHSPDITVLSRRLGPNIGSDHLPVILEFSLPPR
jgi:endonuclease/exonuclease/phosphatase (EEP) superfamily protein YafD